MQERINKNIALNKPAGYQRRGVSSMDILIGSAVMSLVGGTVIVGFVFGMIYITAFMAGM